MFRSFADDVLLRCKPEKAAYDLELLRRRNIRRLKEAAHTGFEDPPLLRFPNIVVS